MSAPTTDALKRAAACAAVTEVENGMLIGLGTGTTAAHAIAALAERVANGLKVDAVATSQSTAQAARAAGITVIDFERVARVDLCIDGVDEIDPALRAIKGAGGAMLREKIVASAADRMIAIADGSKAVARLGARPVPIEILPFARAFVERLVGEMGGVATPRLRAPDRPWLTDQGNGVLDCAFGPIEDVARLAADVSGIPGVLGHGLFVTEIDRLLLATVDGVARHDRPVPEPGGSPSLTRIHREGPPLRLGIKEGNS